MGEKNQLATNMIFSILSFSINLLINFFLSPFIVSNVGRDAYGFSSLAHNFVNYATLFTVALNSMGARYITLSIHSNDEDGAQRYFSTLIFSNLAMAGILFIPLLLIICNLENIINVPVSLLSDVRLLWAISFSNFLISLLFTTYSTCYFVQNRLDINSRISVISLIIRALVLLFLFSTFKPSLWFVGIGALVSTLFTVSLNWVESRRLLPSLRPSLKSFDFKAVIEITKVGIWNTVNRLSSLLFTGLDLLITNVAIGATDMSLFAIAKTIPIQLQSLVNTMATVFAPPMTIAYAKGDKSLFFSETVFAIKMVGFLSSVPIVGFVVFGKTFFTLWQSSLSPEDIKKTLILSVLTLLPMFLSSFVNPLYNVNTITGRLKVPVYVSLALGVVNIIAVLILVRFTSLGVYAVAGISSILILLRVIIFVPLYAAHILKVSSWTFFRPLIRGVASIISLVLFFSFINMMVHPNSWISLSITALIVGLLGYGLSALILFDKTQLTRIKLLLKQKMQRSN